MLSLEAPPPATIQSGIQSAEPQQHVTSIKWLLLKVVFILKNDGCWPRGKKRLCIFSGCVFSAVVYFQLAQCCAVLLRVTLTVDFAAAVPSGPPSQSQGAISVCGAQLVAAAAEGWLQGPVHPSLFDPAHPTPTSHRLTCGQSPPSLPRLPREPSR